MTLSLQFHSKLFEKKTLEIIPRKRRKIIINYLFSRKVGAYVNGKFEGGIAGTLRHLRFINSKKLIVINKGNYKSSMTFIGTAKMGSACLPQKGSSVVLVRDKGGYIGITTAAHEIAHT